MSLLPQRKKSPEEIARLRESLGVPGISADEMDAPAEPPVDTVMPTRHAAIVEQQNTAPLPPPASRPEEAIEQTHHSTEHALPARTTKPVRSLRKSEQADGPTPRPPGLPEFSKLPVHRHSDREISELRRREALELMSAAKPNPKLIPAHPALVAPGYALALAGGVCFFWEKFPLVATAGCGVAALGMAAAIIRLRPLSRHHAAFIAILALLVLVFSALHYFPHLRHAT